MRKRDQERRQEGESGPLITVHLRETRDDIEQKERQYRNYEHYDDYGIYERRRQLSPHGEHPFLVRNEPLEHVHERAALLAGPHGRGIERRKVRGVHGHGVREGRAALDLLDDGRKDGAEGRLLGPLVQDLNGLKDGQAGLDERGELLVEDEEVFCAAAAAPEARFFSVEVKHQVAPGLEAPAELCGVRGR